MSKRNQVGVHGTDAERRTGGNSTAGRSKGAKCPITRQQFIEKGPKALAVTINGQPVHAYAREFDSGSLGWYFGDKITVEIDGQTCRVQVGLNMTVVGSKDLPR